MRRCKSGRMIQAMRRKVAQSRPPSKHERSASPGTIFTIEPMVNLGRHPVNASPTLDGGDAGQVAATPGGAFRGGDGVRGVHRVAGGLFRPE